MRLYMHRQGIWAFLILMLSFVSVLLAAVPIFERLLKPRFEGRLPGPRTLVSPDDTLRAGEPPPALPEPPAPPPRPAWQLPPAPGAVPPRRPVQADRRPDEGALGEVIAAFRRYLDPQTDLWQGRKGVRRALEALREGGYDLLGDPEALEAVLHRARFFEPPMSDRRWRKREEVRQYERRGTWHRVRGEGLDVWFTLPAGPAEGKRLPGGARGGPHPLLVSTIEARDADADGSPAVHLLERRFGGAARDAFRRRWITLVPGAPGGAYVDRETHTLPYAYLTWALLRFVRHYHVDENRILLDGGQEVLQSAASLAPVYAGFVLRAGRLDELSARTVVNFAPVPVYVVKGHEALAEALARAGHRRVTVGEDGPALVRWLEARRRRVPRSFTWRLTGRQHQFAHWVNVEAADWAAPEIVLRVRVQEDTNTIVLRTRGIRRVSLFLNDRIADLERPVRVEWNGEVVREARVARDLDQAFTRDPFRLRESRYFGMLFPARLTGIPAPNPDR